MPVTAKVFMSGRSQALRLPAKLRVDAKEVLVEHTFETEFKDIRLTVPQIGDKKSLLELSKRNASFYRLEKRKKESIKNPR
mgnify:CR=1 FL=1